MLLGRTRPSWQSVQKFSEWQFEQNWESAPADHLWRSMKSGVCAELCSQRGGLRTPDANIVLRRPPSLKPPLGPVCGLGVVARRWQVSHALLASPRAAESGISWQLKQPRIRG